MAITTDQSVLNILKAWYKDGLENLLFRNSPVVGAIKKTRVEGKTQNFAAIYSHGGAVSGDYTKAKAKAAQSAKNAEYKVEPGQIFSVCAYNAKEVQASLSSKGAYMKVAANKLFASSEGFRKTLAAALYGRGYGELAVITDAITVGDNTLTLPTDACMKLDVGSSVVAKASIEASTIASTGVVKSINGNTVVITFDTQVTGSANKFICLDGSIDASGNPILPMGLAGWLPTVGKRTGATWNSYIANNFFGVNRSTAADRLAGAFIAGGTGEAKATTVQKLVAAVRRHGAKDLMVILNDEDWMEIASTIQTTNAYMTSAASKKAAIQGYNTIGFAMSTSWTDSVYDDPYCPKGRFYVLDKNAIELWSYTNVDAASDGIANNEPGKADPMTQDAPQNQYALVVDDYLSVVPGADTIDGASTAVAINGFMSFVVLNPSNCGVGIFDGATPIDC